METQFVKMEKIKQKTNLRIAYDALNQEKKKALLDLYKQEFNQKSESRFYDLLKKPKKMSGIECLFFSEHLKMAMAKVIERNTIVATKKEIAETLKLLK